MRKETKAFLYDLALVLGLYITACAIMAGIIIACVIASFQP